MPLSKSKSRRAARDALRVDSTFLPARVLEWELAGEWPERYERELARARSEAPDAGGWQAKWLEAHECLRRSRWKKASLACRALLIRSHVARSICRGIDSSPADFILK